MKTQLEEAAESYADHQLKGIFDKTSKFECVNDFIAGAKYQAENSYSEEDIINYHEWAENSSDAYDFWNTNKRHPTMDSSHMEYMREKKKELFQIWKSKFKK